MKTVYLSLGSNVGDREAMLQAALDRLRETGVNIRRLSPVYETEPQDRRDQGWFLNLVAEAETELFPMQLLGRVQRIELNLGRRRGVAQGPRTIDIDILLYGGVVIDTSRLTVPHARLHERRFVLAPMVDLAPELRHPVFRRSMRELLGGLSGQQARHSSFAPRVPL